MKYILLHFIAFLSVISSYSQVSETIKHFEYYVIGRESKIKVIVSLDSTFLTDYEGHKRVRKTEKSEWDRLIGSISEYQLSELVCKPYPDIDQESDADLTNLIVIKTNKREYSCGSLNYYDSNKKLKGLMAIIQEIINKK